MEADKLAPSLVPYLDIRERGVPYVPLFRGKPTFKYHLVRPNEDRALCEAGVGDRMEDNKDDRPLCRQCEFEFIQIIIRRLHL